MNWLKYLVSFGTEQYPERTARGLRVLNATALAGAVFVLTFAIYDAIAGLWPLTAINGSLAAFLATLPLWNRLGSLSAPLAYIVVVYTAIFAICSILGTDSGMQLQFLAVAAGLILVLGTERVILISVICALAVLLVVASEVLVPPDTGILTHRQMLENFIICVVGTGAILFAIVFYAVRQAALAELWAQREYERSELLLLNVLPAPIAARLKSSTQVIADKHTEASVLFADIAGFTMKAGRTSPLQLVQMLNAVFTAFDYLVEKHQLEKIKTSGDGYMVVSGVPIARSDHASALASFALDMLEATAQLRDQDGETLPIRIGMASGEVVAGVVGKRRFFYDVWGDAVNLASRMESTRLNGHIQVAQKAFEHLKDQFVLESRGHSDVKGKGEIPTWFLIGRRDQRSQ